MIGKYKLGHLNCLTRAFAGHLCDIKCQNLRGWFNFLLNIEDRNCDNSSNFLKASFPINIEL